MVAAKLWGEQIVPRHVHTHAQHRLDPNISQAVRTTARRPDTQAVSTLHEPGTPLPPELRRLRRTPYAAQSLAIAGIARRWDLEDSAGPIAECGTGKTLISLGSMFVHAKGRAFTALVMAPPQLLHEVVPRMLVDPTARPRFLGRWCTQRCRVERLHRCERSAAAKRPHHS